MYRRRFLSVAFLVGFAFRLFMALNAWRLRETMDMASFLILEAVLLAGFAASRRLSKRGLEVLITLVLAAYPLAYAWGAFDPGNDQTYIIFLLCMIPIFDSLAQPRWYWHWFVYAVLVVAAALFSYLVGYPSSWIRDFSPRVIQILHTTFFVLWFLRYLIRIQMESYLTELAENIVKDKATGLPSLVVFKESLKKGERTLVCLIVVGNFRELTSLFGYSVSTEVLTMVAARLNEAEKTLQGRAFRMRGHDFGFIHALKGEEAADLVTERLRECLRGPLLFQGKTIELSYRFGITLVEDGNADRAMDESQEALDMAERNGMDTAFYSNTWNMASESEIAIADLMTLSRNVSEKTLTVLYQPIVSFASSNVAFNEALVRFKGKGEQYEEPTRFMTLASATGHWAAVEDFVFEKTCSMACGQGGPVSVNIALRDLERKEFFSALENGARKARQVGSALILEILESDFAAISDERIEALNSLRASGFLVALDDFGMGYSNYSRLLSLPVDIVKFDKSMLRSARNSKAVATLVQGLVGYCRDIGALSVAEGIENQTCVDFVISLGFDFGQGYHWSKPVPESKAMKADLAVLQKHSTRSVGF
jgi:EAL domain-containing protein (putative c-di-GMP-specific phosphodiesterase class I)/GGDEF domain-containing protein